jgi:hypothetical protein
VQRTALETVRQAPDSLSRMAATSRAARAPCVHGSAVVGPEMRQALIARRMKRTFRDERGSDLHPSGVSAAVSRSAEEKNSSAEEENSSEALPSRLSGTSKYRHEPINEYRSN